MALFKTAFALALLFAGAGHSALADGDDTVTAVSTTKGDHWDVKTFVDGNVGDYTFPHLELKP